jgi:hypothetical protein
MRLAVYIVCLLYVLNPSPVSAQNLEKYWTYRSRLDSEFLVQGQGQGLSIPADHRNNLINQIKWSDATIDQGWYIGTLATEHYLLRHSAVDPGYGDGSIDLEANAAALYYALKALQRLDFVAETSFLLCPGVNSENGFFIRDDVPIDFHLNFPGMTSTFSDYLSLNIYDKEMSQDQMYHVLLGISLVKRFVDPLTEYNNENLVDLAVTAATQILGHVAGYSNWLIKNPACNKIVYRGPDAWSLAHGTNQMIKWITDGNVSYDNDIEVILNEGVWPAIGQASNPVHLNPDNTHMIMTIGAVGQLWNENTLTRLMNLSNLQDFYLYPMLHAALYGTSAVQDWGDHQTLLDSISTAMLSEAPVTGPASPQPLPGMHGWATANRFIRARDQHINGSDYSAGREYHGLDYMLLHNLRYILFECSEVRFEQPGNETFCLFKKDYDLSPYGFPEGGSFSGPGVLAGQFFNPSVSGPGLHILHYSFTSPSGCVAMDSVTVEVSPCTGADESSLPLQVHLRPNPASKQVKVVVDLNGGIGFRWYIIDALGRRAGSGYHQRGLGDPDQSFSIDLNGMSPGSYYFVLQSSGNKQVLPLVVF